MRHGPVCSIRSWKILRLVWMIQIPFQEVFGSCSVPVKYGGVLSDDHDLVLKPMVLEILFFEIQSRDCHRNTKHPGAWPCARRFHRVPRHRAFFSPKRMSTPYVTNGYQQRGRHATTHNCAIPSCRWVFHLCFDDLQRCCCSSTFLLHVFPSSLFVGWPPPHFLI